jgi:low affinity Fe/Cu permease
MEGRFERLARVVTRWAGSTSATISAFLSILIWIAIGPFFGFSSDYQMIINTGTTIVTFLMVFLLQRSQNKESLAIQLKLNEIVAALKGASNRLINVENLTEEEVLALHARYQRLAERAQMDHRHLRASHSIEEEVAAKLAASGQHLPARRHKTNGALPGEGESVK